MSGGSLGDEVALTGALVAFREAHPRERVVLTARFPEVFEGLELDGPEDDGSVLHLALGGDDRVHLARHYGEQLGVKVWDNTPSYRTTADELEAHRVFVSGEGFTEVVAIDAWAGWPSRRYAMAKWDEALSRLRELRPGVQIIELGASTGDCFGSTRGSARLEEADGCFIDQFTIRGTAAVLAQCDLYLGADSGLAHLAAAVGTPNVVLYGPKPWWARAYQSTTPVVATSHPCACAERSAGVHGGRSCVDDISPQTIAEACAFVLGRGLGAR